MLLKPDRRTAVCGGLALAAVFAAAGLPGGLLQVLPGGAGTGAAVVADPRVRVVSFTGSTAAGRSVGELAGRHLKRVHLELGGNSALVVLRDADIESAVAQASWGSFFHQGQICMTAGRHLVHASLYDEYVERLAARAEELAVGDPYRERVHLGPLIDRAQLDRVHALVEASTGREPSSWPVARTGTCSTDRPCWPASPTTPRLHRGGLRPGGARTVLLDGGGGGGAGFGGPYGLSLGIVTRDAARGLDLADRIPTGIAHINDQTVNDEAVAPFGGVGASGTGARFGGEANLDAFTELRWTTVRSTPAGHPF